MNSRLKVRRISIMKGSKLSKKETLNGSAEIPDAKKPRHAVQRQPVHLAYLGSGRGYHVKKWLPALVAQGLRVTLYSFHAPETTLQGVDVVVLRPPFSRSLARLSWVDFCGPTRRLCRLLLERCRCVNAIICNKLWLAWSPNGISTDAVKYLDLRCLGLSV